MVIILIKTHYLTIHSNFLTLLLCGNLQTHIKDMSKPYNNILLRTLFINKYKQKN